MDGRLSASATSDCNINPSLRSVLSTAELSKRPSRAPDYAGECRALMALAEQLAASPDGILQKLTDTALMLCRAQSAGVSLLEPDGKRFYWPAISGQWVGQISGGTPRDFGPCGTVMDCDAALCRVGDQVIGRFNLNVVAIAFELSHQIGAPPNSTRPTSDVVEDLIDDIVSDNVEEVLTDEFA
jgi:hypothetical protein